VRLRSFLGSLKVFFQVRVCIELWMLVFLLLSMLLACILVLEKVVLRLCVCLGSVSAFLRFVLLVCRFRLRVVLFR